MVDVAPNHMGSGPLSRICYESFIPWNHKRYFHPPKFNPDPRNQTQVEEYWLGHGSWVALPDVNTELSEVEQRLYSWIRELVANYSIDGLRLDTVKHVRKEFWPGFCRAAGVFALGEVWDGNPEYPTASLDFGLTESYTGPYQDYVPGLLDYVTYYGIINGLTKPGQVNRLYDVLIQLPRKFKDVTLLGRFIENHDVSRFASLTTDLGLRKSAFVFNILSDAIPIVTSVNVTISCGVNRYTTVKKLDYQDIVIPRTVRHYGITDTIRQLFSEN